MTGLHYLFILAFLSISPDLLGYSSRRFSMTASGSSSSPNVFHKTRDTDSSPQQNTNTHAHTHMPMSGIFLPVSFLFVSTFAVVIRTSEAHNLLDWDGRLFVTSIGRFSLHRSLSLFCHECEN